MSFINIEIKTIVLFVATLLTGLSAGLCFTWSNAITRGIGKLNDIGYLRSFQQMNRAILNPLFFIVFLGPVLLSFASAYAHGTNQPFIFQLLITAAAIYCLGVFIVTLLGNIPLNNMLENANLNDINVADTRSFRDKFETRWNKLHLIRTISSSISFLLLILGCLLSNSSTNI